MSHKVELLIVVVVVFVVVVVVVVAAAVVVVVVVVAVVAIVKVGFRKLFFVSLNIALQLFPQCASNSNFKILLCPAYKSVQSNQVNYKAFFRVVF